MERTIMEQLDYAEKLLCENKRAGAVQEVIDACRRQQELIVTLARLGPFKAYEVD